MTNSTSLRTQSPNEVRKLNVRQIAQIRAMIPIGKIVRRLGGFAIGAWETVRTGPETYEERPIEMNANQVRAGIALLNKMLPDLQSVQLEVSKNDFEGVPTEQLRARLHHMIVGEVLDVQATIRPASELLALDSSNDGLLDLE